MDKRVMIIDDNEFIRESVEVYFRCEGIKLTCAASGKECLRYLEEGFRGVLLMDVTMPRMDGWDTITQIVQRELYEGNVILMVTAMGEPGQRMAEVQQYVTDYIVKPFNPVDLLNKVRYYTTLLEMGIPSQAKRAPSRPLPIFPMRALVPPQKAL